MTLLDTRENRILLEVSLRPLQGHRFQPTGFADLGAATYDAPDGTRMLLVESAQSMANRLEKVCLAHDGVSLASELDGLPYVEVQLEGDSGAKTSSLAEAHRLNSPFILKAEGFEPRFVEAVGYEKDKAIDWARVANGVFKYDPCCLLHGLFMANFQDGRIKLPRAITAFIEASGVREASSGGVKNNPIDPSGKLQVVGYTEKVYSNVPYHRTEYVADKITACFAVDIELLRSYRLPDHATKLLIALALYKIRGFLDAGMRLRTACDLVLDGGSAIVVVQPSGAALPGKPDLLVLVQAGISECRGLFAEPAKTSLKAQTVRRKEEKKPASPTDDDDDSSDEGEAG